MARPAVLLAFLLLRQPVAGGTGVGWGAGGAAALAVEPPGLHCWLRLQRPPGRGGRHGPAAWPKKLWEEARSPGAPARSQEAPEPAGTQPRHPQRSTGDGPTAWRFTRPRLSGERRACAELVVAVRQQLHTRSSARPAGLAPAKLRAAPKPGSCRFLSAAKPPVMLLTVPRPSDCWRNSGPAAQRRPGPAPLPGPARRHQLSRSGKDSS